MVFGSELTGKADRVVTTVAKIEIQIEQSLKSNGLIRQGGVNKRTLPCTIEFACLLSRKALSNQTHEPLVAGLLFDVASVTVWSPFFFGPRTILVGSASEATSALRIRSDVVNEGVGEMHTNGGLRLKDCFGMDPIRVRLPRDDGKWPVGGEI